MARDRKAEELARNVRAQARGFKNRYAERAAAEHGTAPFLAPKRLGKKSKAVYNKYLENAAKRQVKPKGARAIYGGYSPELFGGIPSGMGKPSKLTRRQVAEHWDKVNARANAARYLPEGIDHEALKAFRKHRDVEKFPDSAAKLGVTVRQYTDAYIKAFVSGPQRYDKVRHKGGSAALKYWFVTLNHYYTIDEYESRYGHV